MNEQKPVKGMFIVVSGPSGSGKTTLVRHIREVLPQIGFSVSCTTRAKRPTEEHGREYFFLTDAEFDTMTAAGKFAEWANVHGKRYGTPVSEIERYILEGRCVISDVDVAGTKQLREHQNPVVSQNLLTIFVFAGNLRQRLVERGDMTEKQIDERLAAVEEEGAHSPYYDECMTNDDLDQAKEEILAIIRRNISGL